MTSARPPLRAWLDVDYAGQLITSNRANAHLNVGVDLNAEARSERCNGCYRGLQGLRTRLEALTQRGGDIANRARDLFGAIEALG
ncbi:Quinone-dependent D-lactate dehydrogenase [Cymbomonas tetramitiformis]|uniref:Quinone-dependent D-lactate dehydrogenase n=1 Tax=Cymbomonas tetramitiformis TaxID=36881 RepID=A0AAE0KWF6_9CHLO|nr:Quinone-dependent D-lactate dehydrogenase [Cymbomonas tetramitiformis]